MLRQFKFYSEQRHIFSNLATQICPALELPSSIWYRLDELGNSDRIRPWRGITYVSQGINNYLCWCFLREINAVPQSNLPHPYEPFISFLEYGVEYMSSITILWIFILILFTFI